MKRPQGSAQVDGGDCKTMILDATSDEALSRASGAKLIAGNQVALLKDAAQNYPAWLEAIRAARQWIHVETYILRDDVVGYEFAEALAAKAREGVQVRLLYDWIGSFYASRKFWKMLRDAGVTVRHFNPPNPGDILGWFSRDHRKLLTVDGRIAFISGLCMGQEWVGSATRGSEPWRDTGVEIVGPALDEVERAFARSWAACGPALPLTEILSRRPMKNDGNVDLRIVAGEPNVGRMYRVDQWIAGVARRNIWIADAYFMPVTSYIQGLGSAAQSGVDVRILLPGANDVPVIRALSRAGLRPLLEAGARIFEWNGTMMHAKTAVADGCWARVGSTNLNVTSWLGNWELDVIVENERFAQEMEQAYLEDLTNATEIVLQRNKPEPVQPPSGKARSRRKLGDASVPRTAAGVVRLKRAVSAAISDRELGPAESVLMVWIAILLLGVLGIALMWPRIIAVPTGFVCAWLAVSLGIRAYRLHQKRF